MYQTERVPFQNSTGSLPSPAQYKDSSPRKNGMYVLLLPGQPPSSARATERPQAPQAPSYGMETDESRFSFVDPGRRPADTANREPLTPFVNAFYATASAPLSVMSEMAELLSSRLEDTQTEASEFLTRVETAGVTWQEEKISHTTENLPPLFPHLVVIASGPGAPQPALRAGRS